MSLWKSYDVYTMIQDSLDGCTISDEFADDCTVDYFMNCDFVTDDGNPYLILTIQEEVQRGTVINNKFKISVECVADGG